MNYNYKYKNNSHSNNIYNNNNNNNNFNQKPDYNNSNSNAKVNNPNNKISILFYTNKDEDKSKNIILALEKNNLLNFFKLICIDNHPKLAEQLDSSIDIPFIKFGNNTILHGNLIYKWIYDNTKNKNNLINQNNSGSLDAYQVSTTQYARLDGDDLLLPNMVLYNTQDTNIITPPEENNEFIQTDLVNNYKSSRETQTNFFKDILMENQTKLIKNKQK